MVINGKNLYDLEEILRIFGPKRRAVFKYFNILKFFAIGVIKIEFFIF